MPLNLQAVFGEIIAKTKKCFANKKFYFLHAWGGCFSASSMIVKHIVYFGLLVIAVIVALIVSTSLNLLGYGLNLDDELMTWLPYIPSEYFQAFGAMFVYYGTCVGVPTLRKLGIVENYSCFHKDDDENTFRVFIATNKGGAVLSARMTVNIGAICGKCVGATQRENGFWPPPQETLPNYKSDLLLGQANVQNWMEYVPAGKKISCIVMTRDPLDRFKSLYQYSFDAGEFGLKAHSWVLQKLYKHNFVEGVNWMYHAIGKETMIDTHKFLMDSLRVKGCNQIKFEEFASNFEQSVNKTLDLWKIRSDDGGKVRNKILRVLDRLDTGKHSEEKKQANMHISGKHFTKQDKKALHDAIIGNKELNELINQQRKDLGYNK